MISLILAVLLVLLVSGLASGTEAALFSIPYTKVRTFVDKGLRGAKSLLVIQENIQRPIVMIVIINNIANIVGSITVGAMAAAVLGSHVLGIFSAILTFLVIIFSEIIPKTLGERYADRWALLTARPVLWLSRILTPIIFLIEQLLKPLNKGGRAPVTSEDEIKIMTHLGQKEGIIEKQEGVMIQRVFRLNDITTSHLMTPRASIDALEARQTVAEARGMALDSSHSRLPVYENDLDNIIGLVHQRDLLKELSQPQTKDRPIKELMQPVMFVPRSMPADDLLEQFQKEHCHLAVVVESDGSTAGVASLEDVLEELVGEIIDETDNAAPLIREVAPGELEVDMQADIHNINEALGVDLPAEHNLSQLIYEQAGKIPRQGEEIKINNVRITITKATAKQLLKARIKKLKP